MQLFSKDTIIQISTSVPSELLNAQHTYLEWLCLRAKHSKGLRGWQQQKNTINRVHSRFKFHWVYFGHSNQCSGAIMTTVIKHLLYFFHLSLVFIHISTKIGHTYFLLDKVFEIQWVSLIELVFKELNHFGVIAGLFRQIGGHSSRFVLFCSFWRLFTIKIIKSVTVFQSSF